MVPKWERLKSMKDAGQEKAKEVIGGAREGVSTFTGKAIKERLDEYSEVYGEVLLGIHDDLLMQKRQLEGTRSSLEEKLEGQRKSIDAMHSTMTKLQDEQLPAQRSLTEEAREDCCLPSGVA